MFGHRSYRGERLELLRWLLVENDRSGYKSYQFSQFLDGATCVDADFIAMRFTTNNGHTIHLGNPVTHFQLGRELCYALQYVDDFYPPRFFSPLQSSATQSSALLEQKADPFLGRLFLFA